MSITIENLVTSGTFSLDGGTWDVDNNVWIVGNDEECVIIDSPHDAAAIINQVKGRTVKAILLTHAHNDHIGAAREVADAVGAPIYLNPEDLVLWEQVYPDAHPDRELADGDVFEVGGATLKAIHTPGHTPACMTYLIGDAAFVGDTLFMPDYGTARCDFPGGDAHAMYRSIHDKLFALPDETRVFMCHDYKAPGREEYQYQTTIGAERAGNVHINASISEEQFVAMRQSRDATLGMPTLILPSVQVNMRAGDLPPAEDNGTRYLKIPLDVL